jgi:hypothetical protein
VNLAGVRTSNRIRPKGRPEERAAMPMPVPRLALAAVAVALVAGGAGWWWWQQQAATAPPAAPAPAVAAAPPAVPPAPVAPAESASAPRHPIAAEAGPALPFDLADAVAQQLGRQAALSLLQSDDFVRRIVATVDNLPTRAAPAALWPVVPVPGRFGTAATGPGATVVGADNAARYARHLALLERLPPRTAAQLYRRAYPAFQRAYADLGYPGAHFNDRLVDVIDLLLATPEPPPPLAVQRPAIGGPVQPARPWVLYEYADESLQARPIGQRILLRLDGAQRQRVREWLGALRSEVAAS